MNLSLAIAFVFWMSLAIVYYHFTIQSGSFCQLISAILSWVIDEFMRWVDSQWFISDWGQENKRVVMMKAIVFIEHKIWIPSL